MSLGILTGCDQSQEWLLSFFWENLQRVNSLPVVFADFGMSAAGRAFCEQRAAVFRPNFSKLRIAQSQEIPIELATKWEENYGASIWTAREAWFKKPITMQSSPFKKTLWLDLDCEVLGDLLPLFDFCDNAEGIALAKEPKGDLYNSGVVAFRQDSTLLSAWAEQAKHLSSMYSGDQELLYSLIEKKDVRIEELPAIYNWRMSQGLNINAVIVHWVSEWGKEYIKQHGGIYKELNAFFRFIECNGT